MRRCNNKDWPCLLIGNAGNTHLPGLPHARAAASDSDYDCETCVSISDDVSDMIECASVRELRNDRECLSKKISGGANMCTYATATDCPPNYPAEEAFVTKCADDEISADACDEREDAMCYQSGTVRAVGSVGVGNQTSSTIADFADYPALRRLWYERCDQSSLIDVCEGRQAGDFCRRDDHLPMDARNLCIDNGGVLTCQGFDWGVYGGGEGYMMSSDGGDDGGSTDNSQCNVCAEEDDAEWCVAEVTADGDEPLVIQEYYHTLFQGMNNGGLFGEGTMDCSQFGGRGLSLAISKPAVMLKDWSDLGEDEADVIDVGWTDTTWDNRNMDRRGWLFQYYNNECDSLFDCPNLGPFETKWEELGEQVQEYAEKLGFSQPSWDGPNWLYLGNTDYNLNQSAGCLPEHSKIKCEWDVRAHGCRVKEDGDSEDQTHDQDLIKRSNDSFLHKDTCIDIKGLPGIGPLPGLADNHRCVKRRCSPVECCTLRQPSQVFHVTLTLLMLLFLAPPFFMLVFDHTAIALFGLVFYLVLGNLYIKYYTIGKDFSITLLVVGIIVPLIIWGSVRWRLHKSNKYRIKAAAPQARSRKQAWGLERQESI